MVPALGSATPEPAPAPEIQSLAGTVVSAEPRWNQRGDRIFTHAVIRAADGTTVEVRQPGGTVDDIGMIQFPSPALLHPGDRVELRAARRDTTLSVVDVVSIDRNAGAPSGPDTAPGTKALIRQPGPLDYVRATTDGGTPLYWVSSCVYLVYDSDGTSHVADEQEFAVMDEVLAHWRDAVQGCSYIDFVVEERSSTEVGFDGVNVVKFREDTWCRPSEDGEGLDCHPNDAAGITTLFFVNNPEDDRYGEIIDADIELNGAERFAISVDGISAGPQERCLSDLANTFTHEVGHLLGLDHTCRFPSEPPPYRRDHTGDEVPLCSSTLPGEILDTTMYPSQVCGETKKSTVEPDDIDAICAIYAQAEDPGRCAPVDIPRKRSWCTVAPGSSDSRGRAGAVLVLLACAVTLLWRARRSATSAARHR